MEPAPFQRQPQADPTQSTYNQHPITRLEGGVAVIAHKGGAWVRWHSVYSPRSDDSHRDPWAGTFPHHHPVHGLVHVLGH
jgi:hypothetical protein